mgnify:CR=1 FL=1
MTQLVLMSKPAIPVKFVRPSGMLGPVRLTFVTSQLEPRVNNQPNLVLALRPERVVEVPVDPPVVAAINALNQEAVMNQDAVGYVRTNLEFHRTLYLRAQTPAMLALCETVWLQLGPTMRALYQKLRRRDMPQHHRMILAALRAGDEPGLRLAVRTDVTQGLRHLAS